MAKYILVAEDDKFYGNIYKKKLKKEGFEVKVVKNGKDAIESIKDKKPDILLLDLVMPVMDGFETLKKLRENDETKNLKILVLSNLGQNEDIKKTKDLGANDYLVKSDLSIDEMMNEVKKYLK